MHLANLQDLELATGYKLTDYQADTLTAFHYGYTKTIRAKTFRAFLRLGLIARNWTQTPRGRWQITISLTPAGIIAAEALSDMAEYGAHVASVARLANRPASDVWADVMRAEGR